MSSQDDLPPWERGDSYVPPKAKTQREHLTEIAHLGGKTTKRNKDLRANGFHIKSRTELRSERNLTIQGGKGFHRDVLGAELDPTLPVRIARKVEKGDLTDAQLSLANRFCTEYLKDFSVSNAYLRAGGNPMRPNNAAELFRWPYVQMTIQKLKEELEEDELLTRKEIIVGLKKEANYHGDDSSSSARVSAWGKLARVKQMDVQITKGEQTVTHRGGVMVVPAPAPTLEAWENVTADVQQKLKDEVTK